MRRLRYHDGTLIAEGAHTDELPPGFVHDDRIGHPRGPAWLYPQTVLHLLSEGLDFEDHAR